MPETRRYSIEIRDAKGKSVLFTAADWTDDERRAAVVQILRLADLPDGNSFTAPAAEPKKGRGKT
jgi:hypothetical protein